MTAGAGKLKILLSPQTHNAHVGDCFISAVEHCDKLLIRWFVQVVMKRDLLLPNKLKQMEGKGLLLFSLNFKNTLKVNV